MADTYDLLPAGPRPGDCSSIESFEIGKCGSPKRFPLETVLAIPNLLGKHSGKRIILSHSEETDWNLKRTEPNPQINVENSAS